MTKKEMIALSILLLIALLVGSCEYGPQPLAQVPEGLEAGPQAWVEFPPHGETLDMGPVPVVVYAASPEGIGSITVSVGGETLPAAELQPLTTDNSARLVRVDHAWQPPGEGEYIITANAGGASSSVRICIVTCRPQEEIGLTNTPTATLPIITLPPDEPTNTPTPTAYSESSGEFWAAPPYVNAGTCTTLNWNVSGDFQTVYYEGALVNASGSQTECPLESRNYQLQVVGLDNSTTDYAAFVEVYKADPPTATKTPLPPPTRTPTPTTQPPPADTNGPTINYVTHIWEGCTIFGEAGITDSSGVVWAEFWFNHNETGWSWIKMNKSGDRWVSQVGIETGGFAGSLVYKVRTEDTFYNESWSGETTHNYAYCGE